MNHETYLAAACAVLAGLPAASVLAEPVGTAFTFQGRLLDQGVPADGDFDMQFELHDAAVAGSQVGSTVTHTVAVTGGRFSVELDFGAVFGDTQLWLQVRVRPDGSADPYTLLDPRQKLTAAPFAHFALDGLGGGGVGDGHSLDAADGNPIDALFVDNDGRVGIGTPSPQDQLHLLSSTSNRITVETTDAGGLHFAGIRAITPSAEYFYGACTGCAVAGTPHWEVFDNNAGASVLLIDANGNVGINGAPDAAPLHVRGGENDGTSATLKLGSSINMLLDSNEIDVTGNNTLHIQSNSSGDVALCTGGGNVGIGTTSPASQLHIRDAGPIMLTLEADTDNSNEDDNPSVVLKQDGGDVTGRMGYRLGENVLELVNEYSEGLVLGTNNTDVLTVTGGGKVGVGTSAPADTLSVVGNIGSNSPNANTAGRLHTYGPNGNINVRATFLSTSKPDFGFLAVRDDNNVDRAKMYVNNDTGSPLGVTLQPPAVESEPFRA